MFLHCSFLKKILIAFKKIIENGEKVRELLKNGVDCKAGFEKVKRTR